MTKIEFTSYKTTNSTHRISDGTESVWFHWPDGASEAEVRGQYEYGYDHNDSDADVEAVIYSLASGKVVRWTF